MGGIDLFADRRADHLLLLVGGNPLPNAVAAELLLAEGGRCTLVHTDDTLGVAELLARRLGESRKAQAIQLARVEDADARSITDGVAGVLRAHPAERIGLHYTGGTKAMATHAYRALEAHARADGGVTSLFSYLDARRMAMVFDPVGAAPGAHLPVALAVRMNLDKLMALHGWEDPRAQTQPRLPELAASLLSLYSSSTGADAWRQWLRDRLYPRTQSKNHDWLPDDQLRTRSVDLPTDPRLGAVAAELRSTFGLPENAASLAIGQAAQGRFARCADLLTFLQGTWLESGVMRALQSIKAGCDLNSLGAHIQPVARGGATTEFELDVAAMRGYQLFAFSCATTTDHHGGRATLKHKLFEVALRARQLGGDEACAALVCAADDPDSLQAEVRTTLGENLGRQGHRIVVFGRRDLTDLAARCAAWIQSQPRA